MSPGFTQKQTEVYEQICELLHEHFDESLLAIQAEADDDSHAEVKAFDYHGGLSTCIGLAEIAALLMKQDAVNGYGRTDEDAE